MLPDPMTDNPPGLVDAVIEDDRWEDAGISDLAERAAVAALIGVGRDPTRHEISLLACDDARIAVLNADFRDRAAATNVLSWPAFDGDVPEADGDEPLFLGDMAISYDTCHAEATAGGIPFADHVCHLVVHGTLHLLGYDHVEDDEAEVMEDLEVKILVTLGIPNPYISEMRQSGVLSG